MQVVIDIPEEEYNKIKENDCGLFNGRIYQMIRNGTPLPKWHGKIIDADKLKQKIEMANENIMEEDWYKLYDSVISDIDNAHTIIEADKVGK